ncbi:MAG: hypothetical protein FJY65_01530 [Calditrichaeota bacterium]|nr:hypothetical protein [Calditrichota bacterium]
MKSRTASDANYQDESFLSSDQLPWEAMLAYVPIFCIYPWTLRKVKPELEAHARQGMILFSIEIFLFLVTVPTFYKLLWIALLILAVLGIWAAFNGRPFRLPILSDIAEKLAPEATQPPPPPKEESERLI